MHLSFSGMKDHLRRRLLAPLAVLLCGLVLLSSAERRVAYLDFQSDGKVRLENNDRPDGDEIIQRLVFVDDATQPIVPIVGGCEVALILVDSSPRSLVVVRLSDTRAPPVAGSSLV